MVVETRHVEWSYVIYDLIVIGSGPGGYSAAVRAGQYGLKTAIIEKDAKLGGTCLHVGCIPTKALLHTAELWSFATHSADEGITIEMPTLNYPKVIERKNGIVSKHAKGVDFLMKKNKVEVIPGFGVIKGPGKVEVTSDKGTQTLETKNILIATGSEARMLPGLQPDADKILTNIEILNMTQVPKSLMIIGAGAVGVEFASMFKRFGSDVSIFEMLPRLVPVEDEEVSKELERVFKKSKIRVETGAKCSDIQKTDTGVKMKVTLSNGKVEDVEAEKLLVAVGRAPNTAKIGLENTKVEVDRGFIKVDQYQQTAEPGIYAIGDVVAGTPQLAHVASMQGMVAVAKMAGKPVTPINRNRIPGATYTEPGIGSVGLTEAQAKAAGYSVKVGKFPFAANSKATILGSHDGFVKVVADEKYGEILGVHIIGPQAYELISEAVAAMEAEATVETMMHTIHAHPTIYEAVGEAFNNVYGLAINA
jgi:dihydrolipoamide dehydrogenase